MKNQTNVLGKRRQRSTNIAAFVFLLPVALILTVFIFYPIVDSFIISTYKWNGIASEKTFIGLANWTKLLKDGNFWFAFRNNIIIMVLSIIIQIPIGLAEATFIEFAGRKATICKV
ncbi:MAG TPA: sugar ABC transporter permease, partial [Candidatus Pelethocola excrementipullorum]|nr:sugar ABC transporter permease [Candidatus Pelethocola excrementipullorum]